MLPELENYDWKEAFAYAGEPGEGSPDVNTVDANCQAYNFTREDVVEIYGIREGENDGDPWRIYGKLNDNRYFYLEAGCDYTGWDCQASGTAWVSSTRSGIISEGLTSEARKIFGLEDDNVGTIKLKGAIEPIEAGFTSIVKPKKEKKVSAPKKEDVKPKKISNNPILGLDIE